MGSSSNIDLTLRRDKGSQLTWDEMDDNLENIISAIDNLYSITYESASIYSPSFQGNPTAPTQAYTDNSTKLATTAFVNTAISTQQFKTVNNTTLIGTGNIAIEGLLKTTSYGVYLDSSTWGSYFKFVFDYNNTSGKMTNGAGFELSSTNNVTLTAANNMYLKGANLYFNNAAVVTSGNLKTVNGNSIFGTGDITIAAGGITKFRFTATEGQKAFVCSGVTLSDPLVFLNGILQDQGDVYTFSGSTVTFVDARYLNEKIVIIQ